MQCMSSILIMRFGSDLFGSVKDKMYLENYILKMIDIKPQRIEIF